MSFTRLLSQPSRARVGIMIMAGWLCNHLLGATSWSQLAFEHAPINYLQATPQDAVSRLQAQLDSGAATLEFDAAHGYLKSVLQQLNVPVSSQVLVFSKTSFQLRHISPRSPRAIYFNDDVYVGWVQRGDVMEASAADPQLGANFYTLDQVASHRPVFARQTYDCLQCHGSTLTQHVPGHVVRSVFPASDGYPILKAGTFLTDHSSPFRQRWGGWYVTGTHGQQWHLGNQWMRETEVPEGVDLKPGANVTNLEERFATKPYLTPHSDLVALMVLEHQVGLHNRLTQANFATRLALRDQEVMNGMLDRPADYRLESTTRRIQAACEPLVQYMLLSNETRLTEPVQGTSDFAREFAARGPRDKQGRSLRDLDLQTRLFKFPCSYLIYSDSFDQLPQPAQEFIYQRLREVLTGQDTSAAFQHLSADDRQAIVDILRDTKANLPDDWRQPAATNG